MSPDELQAHTLAELERHKVHALRVAAQHRAEQAAAKAAGETGIVRTLGVLIDRYEAAAMRAELQRRDRVAAHGGRKARASSKAARQAQAGADAVKLEDLFAAAWRHGMGRVKLQAAAADELNRREERLREQLIAMQEVGNKAGQRRLSSQLEQLRRQGVLCTVHRAGKWIQRRGGGP
ncbi:MAG: hypothetical protein J0L57_16160 [Burkholderiales bacterium]|nr:hypothetical protein [Burkholderiales bacterium]